MWEKEREPTTYDTDVWAQVIIGCEREPTTYDTDVWAQVIIGCDPNGWEKTEWIF